MPKLVCIGAASVIFGLNNLASIVRNERLRGAELVLVDIDAASLETMVSLAHKLNAAWDAEMKIWGTTEREEALPDADFVTVSVQVGPREEVWELDWKIPLKHGVRQPYAENGGPGAFSHTARNAPLVLAIARDMERLCPAAWYLNFTNPVTRLSWIVDRYTDINVVGMCHQLVWGYAIAATVLADRWDIPVPPGFNVHTDAANLQHFIPIAQAGYEHLDIKAAGINHFSWVVDIRDKATGEDLYPLLRERWLHHMRRDFEPLSRELFEIFGLMPTPGDSHVCEYLAWTHDPVTKPWERYDLKLQSWDGNRKRRIERQAQLAAILAGEVPLDVLKDTYSEGVAEIAAAVTFNDNLYQDQLNLPNHGKIPNLPDDAIVETPGMVSGLGIQGLNMPPLPPAIAELCRRELALDSLVIDAVVHGDRDLSLQALLLDPMINDIECARAILDDFLTEFAAYLPQFA